eukprot:GHRQ01039948.1.p1 GENE.GHRQ01039948.1~~GHRQ01039948.1.p1  ORF type:complete len:125 (+),score=19.44 GHRQ01039948.1:244-618(+)
MLLSGFGGVAGVTEQLMDKGSFSYRHDSVNYVEIDANNTLREERINTNIARIYLVDSNNVQLQVQAHITVTDQAGAPVAPFMDNFLITWVDSYVVRVNGQPFMTLNNQLQQSISAPATAASGII